MTTIRRDAEILDLSRDWFRARWHFSLVDVPMAFEPAGIWKGRI